MMPGEEQAKTSSKLRLNNFDLDERMLQASFPYFCKRIGQLVGNMHKEWIDNIEYALENKKYLAIQSSRGHFKTSIMSVAFPLWIAYRYPSRTHRRIGIISATQSQSGGIMDILKTKIVDTPFLSARLLPDKIHSTKWSETHIKTRNGHDIYSLHLGESVRSKHFDFCICDDILKVSQEINIKQVSDLYWSVVYPTTRTRKGIHILVGTPASYVDIFSELKNKEGYTSLKYPAVKLDSNGEWLAPQFPEMFSFDELKTMKQTMPSEHWAREYMCEPLTSDSAMFPNEIIRKAVELYDDIKPLYEGQVCSKYMGCDIAVSKSARADWNVFTVLGSLPGHPIIILEIFRMHLNTEEAVNKIVEMQKRYNCNRINVEKTGVGWGVAEKCSTHEITRGSTIMFDTKRGSKEKMLGSLEVALRNGELAIPNNEILLSELRQFAYKVGRDKKVTYESLGKWDDTVISCALALDAAKGSVPVSISLV